MSKSEIRSKFEFRNHNDKNQMRRGASVFLVFGLFGFRIVSDFEIRICGSAPLEDHPREASLERRTYSTVELRICPSIACQLGDAHEQALFMQMPIQNELSESDLRVMYHHWCSERRQDESLIRFLVRAGWMVPNAGIGLKASLTDVALDRLGRREPESRMPHAGLAPGN